MAKRAVVVGGTGFTGSRIVERLLSQGFEVTVLTGHPARPHPFDNKINLKPFLFDQPHTLKEVLSGNTLLFNTYWIRFEMGEVTFEKAVKNTLTLFQAAKEAGVERVIHISITNPSKESPYPYFKGKAQIEEALTSSGLSYAILRPALVFGKGDILINNIAWVIRSYHFFPVFGNPKLTPIYVEDLADAAIRFSQEPKNVVIDAVGPETLSFTELLKTIKSAIRVRALLLRTPLSVALWLAEQLNAILGEPIITRDEIGALLDNLLYSQSNPIGNTSLKKWLFENGEEIGREFASEIKRHYV
jgi:nucleoside-diphosphate-sugar epimerase